MSPKMSPKEYMKKMSKHMSGQNIVIGVILAMFICAALFGYNKYAKPLLNRQKTANMEHNTQSDGPGGNIRTAEVLFFYADWCPHCKKVKDPPGDSMWDKLKTSEKVSDGTIINGYAIKYVGKDCTNNKDPQTQKTLDKYKVEGFPTFKIALGNEIIEYDAKPEIDSLERFILTTLSR
jgi:thiol-disulfide isomerase/thioredoxin